jgi:hypothetical protein
VLLALSSFKFPSEVHPSLIRWSAALPISSGIRDGTCVQDQKESNVNILCIYVWLHCGIGVLDSILNLFEQDFNWVLKTD